MLMAKSSVIFQLENESKKCFLDELTAKELQLALQLKEELCDEHGKEIEPKKSASLFHKLGKLYQTKTKIHCRSKTLSLIKSAALFNAAIVRLESAFEDAQSVRKNLQQLCTEILLKADATNEDADLIGKAHSVKESIASMRNYVENELKHVPQISENMSGRQLMEQQKAKKIQVIQAQIAKKYTEIMVDIACFCEEAMGKPPCKYAIAGMGSLARKEATPYSDFEHVIVLENIADYKPKLRYFKWYSVIFHVIIINIQETILPSAMIYSLNDHPKFGDWFFDVVTPSGISFDGMMPHACKFPLGRQTPTKKKPWKTELIKPVDEMLEYLQSGKNLKNGYHLSDILTKVCFVFGDHSVYKEFENGVKSIVKNQIEEDVQQLRRQVADDLQNFAISLRVQKKPHDKINVKKDVYRSTTLFISALGRHHKICDPSCFDILQSLQQIQRIDEFTKRKLEYAIAVACEIRLRWYMEQNKQCDVIENNINNLETLSRIVGVPSIVSYFQISYALQNEIAIKFKLKSKLQLFYSHPQMLSVDLSQMFGTTQQLHPLLQNCKSTLAKEGLPSYPKKKQLFLFYFCMALFEKDEWPLFKSSKTAVSADISTKKEIAKTFRDIGWTLSMQKSFREALIYYQKSADVLREIENEIIQNEIHQNDPSLAVPVGYCITETYCKLIFNDQTADNQKGIITKSVSDEVVLTKSHEINISKQDHWCDMGNCLLSFNKPQRALEYFEKVLQIHLYMSFNFDKKKLKLILVEHTTVRCLHYISSCFQRMEKYDDACKYLKCALNMLERLPSPYESEDIPKENEFVNVWVTFGCCLVAKGDHLIGKGYLERAINFFENYPHCSHPEPKRIVRMEIAKSFMRENNAAYVVKNCEEMVQSFNQSSGLDYSHKSSSLDFYKFGQFFFDKLMFKEANKFFKAALNMLLKLSDDVEVDTDIADIHQHLGDSFFALKRYDQAYNHFSACVRIRKQAIENDAYEKAVENSDKSVEDNQKVAAYQKKSNPNFIADIWFKMGKCHVYIDEVDNADLCFRNFTSEMNKLSIDASESLIDIYEMLSNQSLRMQRYEKAKNYLNHLLDYKLKVFTNSASECEVIAVHGYIGFCCIKLSDFGGATHWLKNTLDRIPKTIFNSS